jgi:conjugative relaxase-like TrwC/TraI family protein
MDFTRPERCQQQRTRREDRHSNFYETTDNLGGRFVVLTVNSYVMSAASIPAARGGDYARYLDGKTIAPERGDYYLTPDGELTQAPGRWLADPQTLERLGIQADAPMSGDDFVALMEGRHPQSGRWLRRAGADGSRGGGIDGVFSAPKSVSTTWALADPWQREQIEQAHMNAVEQAVGYMREHIGVVRRRYGGEVIEEPAKDLIAVEYPHTTARGVSGADAPDPQLHSHVVITSSVREDDRIVAVASRPVFRAAGEVGAFYRSALAQELAAQGYAIEQATGKNGKYFEIAGVPEELRDAFSGRSREVARAADRFRARFGRAPERGELRDLALENRRAKKLTNRADLENVWRDTASRYGFGPDEALRLLAGERSRPAVRPVEDLIEERLTDRHSVFELRDLHTVALEQTASERRLQLAPQDAESLRLAYAQHVYRQQGATVDRAVVLTGGWQTSRESAYVQATRARHGTDWYISRDQLGEAGQDPDRITRLAQRMTSSRAHAPSIEQREIQDHAWDPVRDPLRLGRLLPYTAWLVKAPWRDVPERDDGRSR